MAQRGGRSEEVWRDSGSWGCRMSQPTCATAFAAQLPGAVMMWTVPCPSLLCFLPWAREHLTALVHPYVGVLVWDIHHLEALKEVGTTAQEPGEDSREVMYTKGLAQGPVCNNTNFLLLFPSQPRRFIGIYFSDIYMNIDIYLYCTIIPWGRYYLPPPPIMHLSVRGFR